MPPDLHTDFLRGRSGGLVSPSLSEFPTVYCSIGVYKRKPNDCDFIDLDDFGMGFPGDSNGKESACSVGHLGLIPGLGRSLEKGMATHSSILAWRIPWAEEPGGLQSMGS